MSCPSPTSIIATGGTDITKYVVKIGNGFVKRVDEGHGEIVLTFAWEQAKQCEDLNHAQSCAETYGGTVYKVTRTLEPIERDDNQVTN